MPQQSDCKAGEGGSQQSKRISTAILFAPAGVTVLAVVVLYCRGSHEGLPAQFNGEN